MTGDSPPAAAPLAQPPLPIAFCITDLDVGGAEQCLVNIVCGLDRRQWTPHVYCLSHRGALVDRLEQAGIECTCLNWRGARDGWRVLTLARLLRRSRPLLLQTFLFHANIAGRVAARLAGVPLIVSGIRVAEKEKRWHVRLDRLTRRLATHHVCVSQDVAAFSIREARLPPDCVSVIPNGVDVARFATAQPLENSELGAPPGTRWMIAVGRLHPQKGHQLLIEAVVPLLATHLDWRLMIVGEGPLRSELQSQIDTAGCRERIVLLGFRDDVPRLLKTASLFVLSSLWEGQPNVVAEAVAAGLPVVATDVEGVRSSGLVEARNAFSGLVAPGVNGLLVPHGDATELRRAIATLLDDPGLLRQTAKSVQVSCSKLFTTHAMSSAYAEFYLQLLCRQGLLNT